MLGNAIRLPGHPAAFLGRGAFGQIGLVLTELSARRVMVVSGASSLRLSGAASTLDKLGREFEVRYFPQAQPNPTLDVVDVGVSAAREFQPDVIVGVGGGSSLDTAKAIAVLAPQPDTSADYLRGTSSFSAPRLGLVLAPTTCGTGSELTRFATIYIGDQKHSLDSELVQADVALVDPDLARTTPDEVAVASGADALSQAIESAWAVSATSESRTYAAEALELLLPALDQLAARSGPLDPSAHEAMALGAALSGAAINITRTTAAHALSYGLTARMGIPHGLAVAYHLQWLIGHNGQAGPDDCRSFVADLQSRCSIPHLLGRLLSRAGYPDQIAGLHLDPAEWASVWDDALSSLRALNNPCLLTPSIVGEQLRRRRA